MNSLFAAAADVQAFFSSHGWSSTVIGGLAVLRWGEPRQTRDVDLALLTGFGTETHFVDAILGRYPSRIPEGRGFALEHRVLLIETSSGVPVDVSLAALPFEARIIDRSTPFDIAGRAAFSTCSSEDLLVLKAFAAECRTGWISRVSSFGRDDDSTGRSCWKSCDRCSN